MQNQIREFKCILEVAPFPLSVSFLILIFIIIFPCALSRFSSKLGKWKCSSIFDIRRWSFSFMAHMKTRVLKHTYRYGIFKRDSTIYVPHLIFMCWQHHEEQPSTLLLMEVWYANSNVVDLLFFCYQICVWYVLFFYLLLWMLY